MDYISINWGIVYGTLAIAFILWMINRAHSLEVPPPELKKEYKKYRRDFKAIEAPEFIGYSELLAEPLYVQEIHEDEYWKEVYKQAEREKEHA